MERFNLVIGDKTTVGGTIMSSSVPDVTIDGLAIAVQGDKIYCCACKTIGTLLCVGPRQNSTYDGKQDGLSGDLCLCECKPPPTLIHSKTTMCHVITQEELIQQGFAKHPLQTHFAGESGNYDEQVMLQHHDYTNEVAGLPYYIETRDGRHFFGHVGEDGKLPRIASSSGSTYLIHIGDDALGKG